MKEVQSPHVEVAQMACDQAIEDLQSLERDLGARLCKPAGGLPHKPVPPALERLATDQPSVAAAIDAYRTACAKLDTIIGQAAATCTSLTAAMDHARDPFDACETAYQHMLDVAHHVEREARAKRAAAYRTARAKRTAAYRTSAHRRSGDAQATTT